MENLSLPCLRCGNFGHDTMGGDAGYRDDEEQKGLGNANHIGNRPIVQKRKKKGCMSKRGS